MTKPEISVIMSFYNARRHLEKSVLSILNQTYRNFEFIIINDRSDDESLEIIKKYQRGDQRIKLINNDKNIGLTKSLNKGISLAKGKYIARQDSGDISLSERLEKQYEFLEINKDIFLCGTDISVIDEKENRLVDNVKIITKDNIIKRILPKKNCFVHTAIMFRNRDIFYREKFYYSQDYDLYLNLLSQNKKLVNLPNKLIKWRMTGSAISYTNREKQELFARKAKEFYKQRVKKGFDQYNNFNPAEILKRDNIKSKDEVFFEDQMKLYLRSSQFKKAKKNYYQKYIKLKKVNWLNKKIFYIFFSIPIIYKIYRKLVYKNPIK